MKEVGKEGIVVWDEDIQHSLMRCDITKEPLLKTMHVLTLRKTLEKKICASWSSWFQYEF